MAEIVDGLAIGNALLHLREARGMSRQELANLMGSTASSIYRIETNGRSPRLDMLARMTAALGGRIVIDPSGIRVERTRAARATRAPETAAA
jgi:transcriptional regulator with XRE-family HTH domain